VPRSVAYKIVLICGSFFMWHHPSHFLIEYDFGSGNIGKSKEKKYLFEHSTKTKGKDSYRKLRLSP
jgi:hypothetical protein